MVCLQSMQQEAMKPGRSPRRPSASGVTDKPPNPPPRLNASPLQSVRLRSAAASVRSRVVVLFRQIVQHMAEAGQEDALVRNSELHRRLDLLQGLRDMLANGGHYALQHSLQRENKKQSGQGCSLASDLLN